PNENYARELMELFTIGIGHYTQTDVTEVARALTGWAVQNYNRDTAYNAATFVVKPNQHDNGTKTILGQSGNFDGYDAIDIILNLTDSAGSVSGRFMGAKLWSYFAGTSAQDYLVDELQSVYASSGRSIRELVRAIFLHDDFFAEHTRKTWVRSPVEYAVASVRMLEGSSDFSSATNSLAGMGQVL